MGEEARNLYPLSMRSCLSLAVAFLAVGCQSPPSGVPAAKKEEASPTATAGPESRDRLTAAGISLEFPKGWISVDLTQKDFEELMDGPTWKNPDMEKMKPMIKQMAATGMIRMIAFDTENAKDGFVPNFNVTAIPLPNDRVTLAEVEKANRDQLASMNGGAAPVARRLDFGGREASHLQWSTQGSTPDGKSLTFAFQTYLLIHGKEQLTFTFTSSDEMAGKYRSLSEEAMKTLRLAGE